MKRREFVRAAAAGAAASGLTPLSLVTQERPARTGPQQVQEPQVPLGNGEPPALQFQAYPGGTGALMEKLIEERGAEAFARRPIEVEPWEGPVPSSEVDLAFLPVHRLAALVRERHVSSVDLTGVYLERLKRYDPVLLCTVTLLEGRAREEAQQADAEIAAGRWRGPLHGIPWGVKDLFAVRGARTTWGSADFADRVIDEDAEVVVRLREAGAVLLAKLATGEFARGDNWYRGRTRNPWNTEEGSSGSSAGPGSATAAACVAFAIGTETQGSIVSPARRNGVTALRPTFGRVSRAGGMVLAWSMDKVGPLCRSAEDCALVFEAIHGASELDPSTLTTPFRFGRRPDLRALRIGYTENAPESFLAELRGLGADLRPMPGLPSGSSRSLGVESAAAFDFHVGDEEPEVRVAESGEGPGATGGGGRFRSGRSVLALDFVQSQRRRLLVMQAMAEVMKDFDLFVSASGEVGLTNQTGHPAVVLPYAFGPREEGGHEQPLCTTLIGGLFGDDVLLSVAHLYQSGTDWHTRRPAGFAG